VPSDGRFGCPRYGPLQQFLLTRVSRLVGVPSLWKKAMVVGLSSFQYDSLA
jgi:hypothetical protein